MTRPILQAAEGFAAPVIDKVERLLEILGALREDPVLGDVFVLHGGTGLNLFYDRVPRLSVDIDLLYVATDDVNKMRRLRPDVDTRFRRVVETLGYLVQSTNHEHSGQSYRIKYPGDYVKADISYLARVPLLKPDSLECDLADPRVTFPVLQLSELVAGKVKALFERVAARDLYDLWRLSERRPGHFDEPLARALALYAVSISNAFPATTAPSVALQRFENPSPAFVDPLYAMLRTGDAPEYGQMLDAVRGWLEPLDSLSPDEAEYVRLLDEESRCDPRLLFEPWSEVMDRASRDPVMAWKVQNLARRGTAT
ncbi:MAG: nucleotidyl transferase AbiEii/AbiGii toxin family protein [Coriobacteriia bacterium]